MAARYQKRVEMLLRTTIVVAAGAVLSGCIQESGQPGTQTGNRQPPAGSAPAAALPEAGLLTEGATLFAQLCDSCHGTAGNGRGSRSGPSLQRPELTYGRTAAAITQSIRDGRPGGMPAFGHVFTPRQLEALSTYILSLKK